MSPTDARERAHTLLWPAVTPEACDHGREQQRQCDTIASLLAEHETALARERAAHGGAMEGLQALLEATKRERDEWRAMAGKLGADLHMSRSETQSAREEALRDLVAEFDTWWPEHPSWNVTERVKFEAELRPFRTAVDHIRKRVEALAASPRPTGATPTPQPPPSEGRPGDSSNPSASGTACGTCMQSGYTHNSNDCNPCQLPRGHEGNHGTGRVPKEG